jgi:hypothetical protein
MKVQSFILMRDQYIITHEGLKIPIGRCEMSVELQEGVTHI